MLGLIERDDCSGDLQIGLNDDDIRNGRRIEVEAAVRQHRTLSAAGNGEPIDSQLAEIYNRVK